MKATAPSDITIVALKVWECLRGYLPRAFNWNHNSKGGALVTSRYTSWIYNYQEWGEKGSPFATLSYALGLSNQIGLGLWWPGLLVYHFWRPRVAPPSKRTAPSLASDYR